MADHDRYCAYCRTLIPRSARVCPECGTYAGDVFDGKLPRQRRKSSGVWIVLLLLMAAGGGAYWYRNQKLKVPRADTGPVRVVGDRPGGARRAPGAAINEAEAAMTLRHYFAAQEHPMKSECLALIGKGYHDGNYTFDAVNACDRTRLGRWNVEAKSKNVSQ
ncbi:MAG TPA: hypothetical protein VER58_14130 [Thermoanaerobaculia bacterium]|nr:hypothetical protein [Thermoanaerobaculia bacterium]